MLSSDTIVDVALDVLLQSKTRIQESRNLLFETRYRIAASRRRLNPAFACEGSSDDEHQALRKSIRERLATEALFPAGLKVIARNSRGHDCVVCRTPIGPADREYEVSLGKNVAVVSHLLCWVLW